MNIILRAFIAVILSAIFAFPVAAQTPNLGQVTRERQQVIRQEKREIREKTRQERKEVRKDRQEVRSQKIETARQELKEKVQGVREARKKKIVENIYEQVNALNERLTNHFSAVIDQIEVVLGRIENRADKAEANGLDVLAVRAAITEAKDAITASRSAIDAQSEKVYTFEVTGEETLRQDIGVARQALHSDLVQVRQTVVAAREAARKAAVALAQIPRVDELEMPASATPTTPVIPETPETP